MKLSTAEDIEAPIDHVWAQVTNLDRFEAQARKRGVKVERTDPQGAPGIGSAWDIEVTYRGKPRRVDAKMTALSPPDTMRIDSRSGGVSAVSTVTLVPLSPRRTRLQIDIDMSSTTLSGRLLVQSLKFAKAAIEKRFANKVYDIAQGIEERYRQAG